MFEYFFSIFHRASHIRGVLHSALNATWIVLGTLSATAWAQSGPGTQVYFGDTHVHSSYSYDSYTMQNRSAGPEVAYRFARGMPAVHPGFGGRIQLERPLDFLVVADHAEYLGITQGYFTLV